MRTLLRPRFRLAALAVLPGLLGACSSPAVDLPVAPRALGAPAQAVPAWNAHALTLVNSHAPGQQPAIRVMAYVSDAQLGALRGIADARAASTAMAVARATATVLTSVWPGDSLLVAGWLEQERAAALAATPAAAVAAGDSVGRIVGAATMARASADHFADVWTGSVPAAAAGTWSSAAGKAPVMPALGAMRPFYLASGSQFRPAPPPAVTSEEFRAALAEVRAIALSRTAEQRASAEYWAAPLVAVYWNAEAIGVAQRRGLNEYRTARLLAVLHKTMMDANIACHDAKYTYWFWRPSQADASIVPAVALPNHPSYPSNHSCDSGAAAYVLGAFAPDEATKYQAQMREAGLSRIYAGLHYRFDVQAGEAIALKVSDLALARERAEEAF